MRPFVLTMRPCSMKMLDRSTALVEQAAAVVAHVDQHAPFAPAARWRSTARPQLAVPRRW